MNLTEATEITPFADEIIAFETADAEQTPAPGGIVFVGSSSFRNWTTMAHDLAPLPIVRRGFGGSQLSDSVRYAERIVVPYQPKMVVLYAGDNDLASGKIPQQIFADYEAFVAIIHAALPRTRIAYIAIKSSPSRWHLIEQVRATNRLIEARTQRDERLSFINVFTPMLSVEGTPRPELFVDDMLHLNRDGYDLWTTIIRPHVLREWAR